MISEDSLYTKSHEWVKLDDDGVATVGISNHAQEQLGDITYVELPSPGQSFERGDECGVIESVKAASDIYCPVSGQIHEVNTILEDKPETINVDPYEEGWIFRLKPADESEFDLLMDAASYAKTLDD